MLKLSVENELKYVADIEGRIRRKRPVTLFTLPVDAETYSYLGLKGSITCIIGRNDSATMKALIEAANNSLAQANDVLKLYVENNTKETSSQNIDEAFDSLSKISKLAEIRHGQRVLATGYPVLNAPNRDLTILSFPYTGGSLSMEGLELIELCNETSHAELQSVSFINPPKLSDLESASLKLLPSEERYLNVGGPAAATPIAAGVVLATGLLTATAWCATKYSANALDGLINPIDPELLLTLSPRATAAELLNARRTLMRNRDLRFIQERDLG